MAFDCNERRQCRAVARSLSLEKNSKVCENSLIRRRGATMARDRRREGEIEREKGKKERHDVIATPRPLPFLFFFPFSHGFHAKQCFHGAVISFSQRTYSPSWPPVFRLSFPSLAAPPLSLLELSAHFPSYNLRPTSRRRAWTDPSPGNNLHRRRRGRIITHANVATARNANRKAHVFLPIASFSNFSSSFRLLPRRKVER